MSSTSARILTAQMLCLFGLGVCGIGTVQAQQPNTPKSGKPGKAAQKRALHLFEQSKGLYRDGKFKEAAALLTEAYSIFPEPTLLYNLARSLEGLGDLQGAIDAYAKYLKTASKVNDRGGIEHRIATMREQQASLAERSANEASDKSKLENPDSEDELGENPQPAGAIETTIVSPSSSQPSRLPYAIAGVGVATLAVGGYFGWRAKSLHDKAKSEPTQLGAMDFQDDAESAASTANLLFVVGGAGIAVGVAWAFFSSSDNEPTADKLSILLNQNSVALRGQW